MAKSLYPSSMAGTCIILMQSSLNRLHYTCNKPYMVNEEEERVTYNYSYTDGTRRNRTGICCSHLKGIERAFKCFNNQEKWSKSDKDMGPNKMMAKSDSDG